MLDMTAIIQGFIIAIWVVLNLIYFRLGDIREELRELNGKREEETEPWTNENEKSRIFFMREK